MEKIILDECNGFEYELIGEQYYPTGRFMKDGRLQPETVDGDDKPNDEMPVGIWGQRHLRYIQQHKKLLYLGLFVSGKLNAYLAGIDAQAEDFFLRSVKETAKQEGVTEQLKAEDQIAWVQKMNNIHNRITEIVNREIIFQP